MRPVLPFEIDANFTLDAAQLAQRRAERARRLYTLQVPVLRGIGFVILCALLLLQGGPADTARGPVTLPALLVANLAYALGAWVLLRAGHGRSGRLDLPLLLFHLDVLMWLANLAWLEQGNLFFAYFLLVRVVDQVGFGFRRALYFVHVVTLAYLGYALWASALAAPLAGWPQRLGIAASMYLIGLYLAATGLVTARLRDRLRQALHAARSLVEELNQKAAALQAQASELEAARRQADEANLAKSQFLAVTSHEIRTPMNGILGTAELLMETELTPTQKRYVQTAHRSASALLALINDVLDLSRIENGKLRLNPSDIDLRELVVEAVELVAVTARDRPIELRCAVSPRLPQRVHADPLRLRQLLVNLLHNAAKFTERGSVSLDVDVLAEDAAALTLRVAVTDTGIGIAPDQLDTVFEAFEQVDASSTRRHGGSGLGLAIVKDLAALMGGRVGVESEPGVGSCFWAELVFARAAAAPEPPQAVAHDDEARPCVLVVEDDTVNQMIVEDMLKVLGCEVQVVDSGALAVQAAGGESLDLVFMDCHMPLMDGYEATRRIRRAETAQGRRRLPIVALTADTLQADRERCLEAGMDDFLSKPVSRTQLAATISRWTGRLTRPVTQW
jgi:signal transduction histidine kinase/ActR/RegA family two-component response regulator